MLKKKIVLNVKVHRKLNIVKILSNQAEVELWKRKSNKTVFMNENVNTNYYTDVVKENVANGR